MLLEGVPSDGGITQTGVEMSVTMREMLDADEPYLLEVIVPFTEHVLPMIPQGKSAKEMLID